MPRSVSARAIRTAATLSIPSTVCLGTRGGAGCVPDREPGSGRTLLELMDLWTEAISVERDPALPVRGDAVDP